ncbi:Fur family transcriptional regulator [Burkholderia multivorans]|uniref:Fur family transcriptional regulator n=1 Tax=Burkholderia multivorans TaxID=87883 RepID=A0AB37AP98_9BURK|nr:Fur family transcriptional regulator [Burkholderia multivorans]PRE45429.1 Fur family transcriptional regulator [Burkholderia multivorans]PRE52116.1 Fur family transcriptional regulator [Burkholderia multivorans]
MATDTSTAWEALEARCTAGGHRLTPLRRQVLDLLLKRGGRATAYEIINDLPSVGRRPSPPSVYRALEFLMGLGVVNRVAATSTFVVSMAASPRSHTVLLVCRVCGATEVLADEGLERALSRAAGSAHYEVRGCQTEVSGICGACQHKRNTERPTYTPA